MSDTSTDTPTDTHRDINTVCTFRHFDTGKYSLGQLRRLAEHWDIDHQGMKRAELRHAIESSPRNISHGGQPGRWRDTVALHPMMGV